MKARVGMDQAPSTLFPEISPYRAEMLKVSEKHQIYFEECGNPMGYPVVFLHGGPGSGCNSTQRRFFDPHFYRVILLDQRGCGRSTPQGCIQDNDTNRLLSDIEALKIYLGIEQWLVFGGSWGSTLALAYALAHPQSVTGLILRGIFLSRSSELNWFLGEVKEFYPEPWATLLSYLPASEQDNVLAAYAKRVFSEDNAIAQEAAIRWNAYESSIMSLLPREANMNDIDPEVELARARVQIHYIRNHCFVGDLDWLNQVKSLENIPTTIIQGRYDMVCPPISAWELKQAMPNAAFEMIADAGHSAMEPGITSALVKATEAFKNKNR
jgi:proline iminopeptidase